MAIVEAHERPPKKRWRFSLGTLLVLAPVIPALLAVVLQYLHAEYFRFSLEQQTQREQYRSRELNRMYSLEKNQHIFDEFSGDPPKTINVSLVPSHGDNEWFWQIDSPYDSVIRMAFDNIPAEGLPGKSQSGGARCVTASWFKIVLHKPAGGGNNKPDDQGILIASTAFGGKQPGSAGTWSVNYPRKLHLWSVAGRGRRESFPYDEPVVLLRMRDTPRHEAGEATDSVGRGLMVWIERAQPKVSPAKSANEN